MTNVYTVLSNAKRSLASDFRETHINDRINTVRFELVDPRTMATHLYGDNYRSAVRIPGYYDPNQHTIFLNKKTLPQTPQQTAHIICYHELVHSISAHRVVTRRNYQLFQSGIKLEIYTKGSYRCLHRAMNEGMVQYLTAYYNNVTPESYAYAQEVAVIQKIAQDLGHRAIYDVITLGKWRVFQNKVNAYYGAHTFAKLSHMMDKKQFAAAHTLLACA